jgi:hypothetical protein
MFVADNGYKKCLGSKSKGRCQKDSCTHWDSVPVGTIQSAGAEEEAEIQSASCLQNHNS